MIIKSSLFQCWYEMDLNWKEWFFLKVQSPNVLRCKTIWNKAIVYGGL